MATFISVRVSPNATHSEVVALKDGVWQIKVSAPPVKGKANNELIAFLSKALGVSKGSLSIAKGHASRNKFIAIEGLTEAEIIKRLSSFGVSRK